MLAARQIIDNVMEKYSSCLSYQDSGEVNLEGIGREIVTFTSCFNRPSFFCFDWIVLPNDSENRTFGTLSSDGIDTFEQERGRNKRRIRNLSLAIHRASLPTFGASRCIASLLLPDEVPNTFLLGLGDLRLLDSSDTEFVVSCTNSNSVSEI